MEDKTQPQPNSNPNANQSEQQIASDPFNAANQLLSRLRAQLRPFAELMGPFAILGTLEIIAMEIRSGFTRQPTSGNPPSTPPSTPSSTPPSIIETHGHKFINPNFPPSSSTMN